MRVRLVLAALLALAVSFGRPVAAQAGPAQAQSADSLTVSLLTMLPGEEVYSLFGHSAIRIRSDARGLDRTYNFGTFDFEQPFFMARFARGQLDYILDTAPFADELAKYRFLGRPIIEQRLALSQESAETLLRNLDTNALPDNRAYRYDFFFDNCSTRLLDVIEAATVEAGDGPIGLAPAPESPTFRELLRTHTRGTPTIAFGMDLALGTPADRVATAREQTFLPVGLADALDRARVGGRPLVTSRDTLFWVAGAGHVPARPEPVVPALLAVLAVAWLASAARPSAFEQAGRLADTFLLGAVGIVGLVLAFLWLATDHTVTGPNANLLWAFPGHLALAWAVARHPAGLPAGWRRAAGLAAVAALAAVGVHLAGVQTLPAGSLLLAALVAARTARLAMRRHGALPLPR